MKQFQFLRDDSGSFCRFVGPSGRNKPIAVKFQKGTKLLLEGSHIVFKRRLRAGVEILGMVMSDNLMSRKQVAYKQMAHRRTTMWAVPRLVQP